jgi:spore coat-associated protein N
VKRILSLTIASFIILAMVGVGTWAYFSDTEQSTGNVFTAGTLNLKLSDANETDQNGVTASFTSSNFNPGASVGPSTVTLKNTGNVTANHVDIKFTTSVTDYVSYDASDLGSNIADMSTVMKVTALSYAGTDLLTQTTPGTFDNSFIEAADNAGNNDGFITVNELNNKLVKNLTAPAANDGTEDFVITIAMDSSVGNGVQGDAVTVTVTFGLYQDASQNLS